MIGKNRNFKEGESFQELIIDRLMQFMSAADLSDVTNIPNTKVINFTEIKTSARQLLLTNFYRNNIDRALLQCLYSAREITMSPILRETYSSELLWIGMNVYMYTYVCMYF